MTPAERASVKDITSDAGNEMTGVYSELLTARGMGRRTKDPRNRLGTAIVDRAIGTFKKMMLADMKQPNSTVWYNRAEAVAKAYNDRHTRPWARLRPKWAVRPGSSTYCC